MTAKTPRVGVDLLTIGYHSRRGQGVADKRAARLGAATFALGLSLVGPGLGMACAETAGGDIAAVSAGADSSPRAMVRTAGRESRGARAATRTVSPAARRVQARVDGDMRHRRPVVRAVVQNTTPVGRPRPAAAASSSTSLQPNAVRLTAPVRRESGVPGPGITAAAAVNEFFTASADWLAALPVSPVTDFLQAGLLLVRRTLFNQAPVVKPELVIAKVGAPAVGNVGALDVDGDRLTYVVSQAPAHGEVAIAADGSFVFTPEPGFRGADSFTVSVADPGFPLNLVDLDRPLEVEAVVSVAVGLVLLGAGVPAEDLYRDFVPIADCGCRDTWSFLGMVYRDGQCGNPDSDANGPWCRLKGTYNGADWSYCESKDS